MTHKGRVINNHDRIFLSKCNLSRCETHQRQILTFLTESASEAIHTLALLPRPAVQTGAPMSAGVGGAGSFQSRTSTDRTIHKLTIRQPVWQVSNRGVYRKRNSKKGDRWAVVLLHVQQYKTPHKEPQRISILKDPSSFHYSAARKKKKSPEFCNWFPSSKICHFY